MKKFLTLMAISVFLLTGCGPSNGTQSQNDGQNLVYTDPAYKFSFSYSKEWKVTPFEKIISLPVPYMKALQMTKINGPYVNIAPTYIAVVQGTDFQKIVQKITEAHAGEMDGQKGFTEVSQTQEININNHSGYKGQFKDQIGGTEYFYVFPIPNRNLMLYLQYPVLEGHNQINEAIVNSVNFNT